MTTPNTAIPSEPIRRRREPSERILRITRIISEGSFPNTTTLSAQLRVSPKTIQRDLEHMADLGAPLKYEPSRHGYTFTRPWLPMDIGALLTDRDLLGLVLARKALAAIPGPPPQGPDYFGKLTSALPPDQEALLKNIDRNLCIRHFAPEPHDASAFAIANEAVTQERVLTFEYRKPGQDISEPRRVHPYHLACVESRWYVIGFDPERGDIRTFLLSRMSSLALSSQRFNRPPDFDVEHYLSSSLCIMCGAGDYHIVIDFDKWATDILRGRRVHHTQEIQETSKGSRVRMRLSSLEEVLRWILGWGQHANALGPAELVRRLACESVALAARYVPRT